MSNPTPTPSLAWLKQLASRFIVFDGPDASGKTTQFHRFIKLARETAGLEVCGVREPGGTAIGERLRPILLDPAYTEMHVRTEMLLYMASRAQLVAQLIAPALAAGRLVVADRFISSTLAYQGAAGGLSETAILAAAEAACGPPPPAPGGTWPDLTIIFDVDEATAAARLNPLLDRIEQKNADFHAKVRRGYLEQAKRRPDRYAILDARPDPDTVTENLLNILRVYCS